MTVAELKYTSGHVEYRLGPEERMPSSYRIHLAVASDPDGGVSAFALNLPGAGSCGETEEEAVANAREAIIGVIEEFIESREEIPWLSDGYSVPEGAKSKWILVNA